MFDDLEPEEKEEAIHEEDSDGNTPLTLAVQSGNREAVAMLLTETKCKTFMNSTNKQGERGRERGRESHTLRRQEWRHRNHLSPLGQRG